MPFFIIMDIENISRELSLVSGSALGIMGEGGIAFSEEELNEKLDFIETGESGVIVAVAPGLRRLLSKD